MGWGCCGVALIAVLPIWRAPMATPAGKLLFFEALSLSKICGCGGRCWLWWLCGRADLSFCYRICFLVCSWVGAQPSLGSDTLLWLLHASGSRLCFFAPLRLRRKAMDSRESSHGAVSHPPCAHQITILPVYVSSLGVLRAFLHVLPCALLVGEHAEMGSSGFPSS